MKQKLLIFPYNGNGIEAIDCIDEGKFTFIGFIDDTAGKLGKKANGIEVFGREALSRFPDAKILAVPGSPESFLLRQEIISSLNVSENRFATIIHPKAVIGGNVKIGYNCLIMAGVVLTSNVVINDHVCILSNTVIHHDSYIGNYTLIGSNISIAGNTKIESNCYIGSGTNIINGINIGAYSLIGLGSNVIKTIPARSKVAGNPARAI